MLNPQPRMHGRVLLLKSERENERRACPAPAIAVRGPSRLALSAQWPGAHFERSVVRCSATVVLVHVGRGTGRCPAPLVRTHAHSSRVGLAVAR
jgi:hypothetical protein